MHQAPANPVAVASTPALGTPHPEPAPGTPHPEPAPGTPHPEPASNVTPPPLAKDVTPYYALAFAVRKELPPLKLSMHVYAADPKQRFVILNQARVEEGETTPDGVELREVRPDGVILEFKGQQFFYPRDGQ
jgi:general secretion pathway protein B